LVSIYQTVPRHTPEDHSREAFWQPYMIARVSVYLGSPDKEMWTPHLNDAE